MLPSVELEVITSVLGLARSGGDVVLGRGMSRAGGDDGKPTATTPDGGALARVLQRSLEASGEQQLQSDEQAARALQLAWEAEEQEEQEELEEERRFHETINGSRPPPSLAPQTSRAKMLAFLRARGTASTTRFTARLLDGNDFPREIAPSAGESALLAGYAPPPPTMASPEAAAVVVLADAIADARPLSAAAPEGRYDSRVQRAKRANLARKLSSDGKAPLLTKQGSSQSVCSLELDPAGGVPAAE